MLNKLTAFMSQYQMVNPGDTVNCAVSGGADSMALLFAMYLLKDKLGFTLQAAHFNHKLRGKESDEDEAFVRKFCETFDIPIYVGSCQVISGKKGLEAAARDARYGFLSQLEGKIATAHTANDNAETVLMHLVRGTGLKGLGGIAPVRGNLIRPMLNVTRQQVLAFLEEYHIPHREDSSNETDQFLRNRLRHRVMPLLEAENPRIGENLSAMALRLRQDEEALSTLAAQTELNVESLKAAPNGVRSRALERFLKASGVKEPEAEHIRLTERLIYSEKPSARANLPGGVTVCRSYDTLTVLPEQGDIEPVKLPCPGSVWLPGLGMRVTCRPAEEIVQTPTVFTVKAVGELTLRSRRAGDAIRLSGGSKSLKKLFIDRKIPASHRSQIPVLEDSRGIVGVYGIGADEARKASELPAVQIRFETE